MPGGLLTELYELNTAASYLRREMTGPATFSLFVRRLPADRPPSPFTLGRKITAVRSRD
jgi:nicotinic acid phosphoribosyltransferase